MTSNGAAIFALIMVAAAMTADARGLVVLYAVAFLFAAVEVGPRALVAVRRALWLVLPLAAFLFIVWVAFVGRSPDQIAAALPGTRVAASRYAATVCARLFLIVAVLQIAVLRFSDSTPLQAIRTLRVPLAVKRQLVLTLSLIETLRHAIDRAHMALTAAGVITRRLSLRNVIHGWVLVQTVWLTAITSVSGRMRDKWPIEGTLELVGPALDRDHAEPWRRGDLIWPTIAAAAAAAALLARVHGAA